MPEDFENKEAPVLCSCGNWFDLFNGNGCKACKTVYCSDCLSESSDVCKKCKK